MAATSASDKSVSPIVVPGQLTLRTIRGKNGPFTVGRLATHLGTFEVKDPELEQYPEGKYDGEFIIRYIFPKSYPVGGGMRFEIRASLDGMTLYDIDKLSRDEHAASPLRTSIHLMKSWAKQPAVTPAKPAKPAKRPGPPSPHLCRHPQTRWSIPPPLVWMRRRPLRRLPPAVPKRAMPRCSACCGRWMSP